MTTYTTTAIATSFVTNTVTVASISNMFPGLPITFSGITFGGITEGSAYYIGTIIYGYPTSQITLTSLPGGAVFDLTTATGSMAAEWASGGQQIIVTTPPGENLNTAFTKINTNFDQLWAAGPVNSNIKISENTIYTLDTNGDLILNPNGIGNVVANAHVVPDTTLIRNLGSPTKVWNELYVAYAEIANIDISQLTIPVDNLHILGGNANNILSTDGDGNLSWIEQLALAGGANTQIQFNNNGVLDGSSSFTFASSSNTVTLANLITTGTANLNSVSNVTITGGTSGYVLQTDGLGNLSWVAPIGNTQTILDQQIAGDNSTDSFTLITPAFTNSILVSINGVQQLPNVSYSVAGNTITFTQAPAVSDIIDIRFLVGGEAGNGQPGGSNGTIQFNSGNGLDGTANLTYNATTGNLYSANVTVSGNITASYYYGNGSYLTGVTATANTGTITFANNVISTSNAGNTLNIIAPQSTPVSMATGGNSATSQLLWATNIGALTPAELNNGVINGNTQGSQISAGNTGVVVASNSAVGLRTWTFGTNGTLSGTGNISAGNINANNISVTGTVTANVDISAVGNVSGAYILGNAAFATGIPASYDDANVYTLLDGSAANIIPLANVAYSLGNATSQWKDLWVSNSTIYMNSIPITLVEGNVLTVAGNAVITANSLGNVGFIGNTIYDINGIGLENSDLSHGYTAGIFIPTNGDANAIIANNTYGNIILQAGANANPTATWSFKNDGTTTFPNNTINPGAGAPIGIFTQSGNAYTQINQYPNTWEVYSEDDNTGANSAWAWIRTDLPTVDTPQVFIENQKGSDGVALRWTFDAVGNLTLPNIAAPSINYANGQPYGSGVGGNSTTIVNGTSNVSIPVINSNVSVNADGNIWNFDATGNLTFPNSATISNLTGASVFPAVSTAVIDANGIAIGTQVGTAIAINSTDGVYVLSDNNAWVFGTDGSLTLPIGVANNGRITNDNGISFKVSSNYWTFDPTGNLTLPDGGVIQNSATVGFEIVGLMNYIGQAVVPENTVSVGLGDPTWGPLIRDNPTDYEIEFNGGPTATITGASGLAVPGAEWTLTGIWPANPTGAPLTIRAKNYTPSTDGIKLSTSGNSWVFNNTGNLTLPTGGSINTSNGTPYGSTVIVTAAATGAQTIVNAASAAVLAWTEISDTSNAFASNTFTAPLSGFYQVNLSLYWGAGVTQTAGFVAAVINPTGSFTTVQLLNGAVGAGAIQNVSRLIQLTAGDELEFLCAQTTGGDQTPDAAGTTLSIYRIG